MTMVHKACAAALFCGAMGFAHSSYAAQPANPAATSTENGATQAPALQPNGAIVPKRISVPPPQGGSERTEQERTAELNKQSLQSLQTSGLGAPAAAAADEAPTAVLPAFGKGRQVAGTGGRRSGGGKGARSAKGGGAKGGGAKGGGARASKNGEAKHKRGG